MKRPAIVFFSILLSIPCASTASPAGRKEEDRAKDFFAPSPGIFNPQQDTSSDSPVISRETPNLLRQIGGDFRSLFTEKENLLIVGAGLGVALAASPFDQQIPPSRFNSELFEGGELDRVFESGEVLGGALVQVGGAVAAYGLGKLSDNPGIESLGRDLLRAQVLTQSVTQAVKFSVARTRPDGSSNRSFPSGHSAGAFATATVLQRRYGWKAGIPAYGFAAYVAASRLSENKHYLSDVLFGAAIGIMAGRTVTLGRGPVRFALAPMIPPGGGLGIQATLMPHN